MAVLLTFWLVQLLLALLGIATLVATLWAFFSDTFSGAGKAVALAPAFLTLLCAFAVVFGMTHAVVEPNTVLLVVDRNTGQPIMPLRTAGVTEIPLWTSVNYRYPAQTNFQWCPTFTPSSRNGAGLVTVVCFTADASKIDWVTQFKAFNGGEVVITAGWQTAVQTTVANAISQFDPRDLTNRRADVETEIYRQTLEWFTGQGIPVTMVGLKDWRFASEAINQAYDQAQLAQTQIDVAEAENQAAMIRANTTLEVAKTLAVAQRQACTDAGMVSETACLQYLQLLWLSQTTTDPTVVVVNGGDVAPAITIPSGAPAEVPAP